MTMEPPPGKDLEKVLETISDPKKRDQMLEVLSEIVDPEINVTIMELKLIDVLEERGDGLHVEFHQTTPYCPPVFALKIAQDVKNGLSSIEGINSVNVNATGHYMSDYINKVVNNQMPDAEE